jgi:hypothetical protein
MPSFFRKSKKKEVPQLFDLDNNLLVAGDVVESFRYDLGKCEVIFDDTQYYYQPINGGKPISWLKMIDASTDRQKVRKIEEK